MKAWFEVKKLKKRVGIITDYFQNYIELRCVETNEYYIVHEDKVKFIYS